MRTKLVVMFLVGMFLLLIASSSNAEMRKWTRQNGKQFEAEFVKFERQNDGARMVTLRKPDGTEMTVHLLGLSEDDQKYVIQMTKGKEPPTEQPATPSGQKPGEVFSVAGIWKDEWGTSVTIRQHENTLNANGHYKDENRWHGKGSVSKEGEVTVNVIYTLPADKKSESFTAHLAHDGKTLQGVWKWEGGEKEFTLTFDASGGDVAAKPHRKKPHANNSDVAKKKGTSGAQPEEPAADLPKTMIVEAKGGGKDRDEALKDAFRHAIRKVVGAYVEEETIAKNDEVIKDQVLTYSGGCVKDHGVLSDYKDGSITIWALVEQDKVVKRLKAASVSVKEVAGGKIWDEIQTKRWKDKEAQDLLHSVLKDFPENCMRAEVVGEPKHEDKGDKIEVTVTVQFSADEQAYGAFRERLMTVLDHIADESTKELLSQYEECGDQRGTFVNPKAVVQQRLGFGDGASIFVNTSRSESWTRLGYKAYKLDKTLEPILAEGARRTFECVLSSQDKSGKRQLVATFVPQNNNDWYNNGGHLSLFCEANGAYFVARSFKALIAHSYWGHTPKPLFQQKIDMTENEVKNLSKIKCELRFSEGR